MEPVDHLFRHEAGRMVALLTRIFGIHNLALAEDVVQEALLRALEVWKIRGIPQDPSAWLLTTAKNCVLDALRRERTVRAFAPEVAYAFGEDQSAMSGPFETASDHDDQLRLMFSCCHPHLPEEAQVALILHILCAFSVAEVASAFLSGEEAIKKRIQRAKAVLSTSRRLFELTDSDFTARLSAVHRALYLLFNEGYHGASSEAAIRKELCQEALRLTSLLAQNPLAATPTTYALSALMCFQAARLPARVDEAGELSPFFTQDRSRWDPRLLAQGQELVGLSASGTELSSYHIEAGIAALHASVERAEDTPWKAIVPLYDALMRVRPSPVVALQRALAIAERDGPERGLEALCAISDRERLAEYPFYFAALGELELRSGRPLAARGHFATALTLARSAMERRFLERRIKESSSAGASDP
jgi:RNA polymerase sigma-70 factor (ECF subfamily)